MKHEVSAPKNTKSTARKQPLESSGMEIPDYAIERLAKCLLPLMRKHFESIAADNTTTNTTPPECVA